MDVWQTADDCFEEGRMAREYGKGRFDNPYEDDDSASAWENGWRAGTPELELDK